MAQAEEKPEVRSPADEVEVEELESLFHGTVLEAARFDDSEAESLGGQSTDSIDGC